jgi:hypothetical protein
VRLLPQFSPRAGYICTSILLTLIDVAEYGTHEQR